MSMKKGKHYGVYENGPRKGESWFDNSYDDLGDQALRQGILTGKILNGLINNKKHKLLVFKKLWNKIHLMQENYM